MLGDDRRLQLANLLLQGDTPDAGAAFNGAYAQGAMGSKMFGKKKPGFNLADLFADKNQPLSLAPPAPGPMQGNSPAVGGLSMFGGPVY